MEYDPSIWDVAVLFVALGGWAWHYLTTGGTVTVKLEQNEAQNGLINYVIDNTGNRKIEDVRVKFGRPPAHKREMWTASEDCDTVTFRSLSPGERHVSMFCSPFGGYKGEPLTAEVSYVHGPLLLRWPWLRLPIPRVLRRITTRTTLDPREFFEFRFNTGFPGKDELEGIEKHLKEIASLMRKADTRRTFRAAERQLRKEQEDATTVEIPLPGSPEVPPISDEAQPQAGSLPPESPAPRPATS